MWVGAEAFGNLVGATKGGKQQQKGGGSGGSGGQALSRPQAIAAIREDYDQNYFVSGARLLGCLTLQPSARQFPGLLRHPPLPSPAPYSPTHADCCCCAAGAAGAAAGVGSMSAYAPDCLFADPFAGFNGTDRFRRNVSNLGGLMCEEEQNAQRCAVLCCACRLVVLSGCLPPPHNLVGAPFLWRPLLQERHSAGHHGVAGRGAGADYQVALQRNPRPALAAAPGGGGRHHPRL